MIDWLIDVCINLNIVNELKYTYTISYNKLDRGKR